MGGGIACVTATRGGLPVRIKDINETGINHALKYSWDVLGKRVRSKRMRPAERQKQMMLISGSTDYTGFEQVDVVVEAVFEDLALKQQMVAEVEANCAPHTVFASNTSSLPIGRIAEKAQRPQQVIGLHYFSPVDKMPLVEVIPHAGTSEETIATTVALAHKQGKTAIVVGDSAGFTSTAYWRRTLMKRRAACWKASRLSRWTRRWWTSVSRLAQLPCWMKWVSTSAPKSSRYWSRRWGRALLRRLRSMRC